MSERWVANCASLGLVELHGNSLGQSGVKPRPPYPQEVARLAATPMSTACGNLGTVLEELLGFLT